MKSEEELLDQLASKSLQLVEILARTIATKERELDGLREKHAVFSQAAGLSNGKPKGRTLQSGAVATPKKSAVVAGVTVPASTVRPKRSPSSGLDWGGILAQLPRRFASEDVSGHLPKKAPVTARNMAIARWMRFGKIQKIGAGQYRKVGPGSRGVPGASAASTDALAQL
jgi:hypothetical protein